METLSFHSTIFSMIFILGLTLDIVFIFSGGRGYRWEKGVKSQRACQLSLPLGRNFSSLKMDCAISLNVTLDESGLYMLPHMKELCSLLEEDLEEPFVKVVIHSICHSYKIFFCL